MANNREKKRVAIYCRVSTTEQAEEGYSIGEQERVIAEYCEKHGYEIYKTYSDKGISGKDIKHRPQMIALLKDAEKREFDMVMSWKITRLSRKLKDALEIVETLEKYNITYRSYSEPFENDTPAGKMQFQMLALVGEFERNTISQNVKMGMCAKARAGEWCGGSAPLGYDCVPDNGLGKRTKSSLQINEEEARIVRHIFTEYASGKGYKTIVGDLNRKGCKTKYGNAFSIAQIKPILTNPTYIGKIRFNVRRDWNEKRRHNINPNPIVVDGHHEPIIEQELWDRVQVIIANKSGKPSRIYDGEYPLTGILKCPVCGAGMVLSRTTNTLKDGSKNRIAYYACGNWKSKGTTVCHSNAVRVEYANRYVYEKIEKLLCDDRFLKSVLKKLNEEQVQKQGHAKNEIVHMEKKLDTLMKRRKKIFEMLEDEVINLDEFVERKKQLAQEEEQVKDELEYAQNIVLEAERGEISYELIKQVLENFSKVLSGNIDRSLRKQLLHMLVKEITIDKSRKIDTIKLHLTDELIRFLESNGGTPVNGVSPIFMCRTGDFRMLDLEIAI